MHIMISFDAGTHRFNLRAAAVIFQRAYVLLHRVDGDDFWSLPGGRVEPGEDAAKTAIREMLEEVGASIQINKMLCVVENFFSHKGQENHEIGLYFTASLVPGSPLLNLTTTHRGSEEGKGLTFSWFSRQRLSEIEMRPVCLRQLLQSDPIQLAHIVQRDSNFEISY